MDLEQIKIQGIRTYNSKSISRIRGGKFWQKDAPTATYTFIVLGKGFADAIIILNRPFMDC
jgi:hypothetical protein